MDLPPNGTYVSTSTVEEICFEHKLYGLWAKILKDLPPKHFKSDGCSWWPDVWKNEAGDEISIYNRCFIHDLHYWAGHSEENNVSEQIDRFRADCELVIGVVEDTGNTKLGEIIFDGVRVGGHELWRLPFSWGFGRQLKRRNEL